MSAHLALFKLAGGWTFKQGDPNKHPTSAPALLAGALFLVRLGSYCKLCGGEEPDTDGASLALFNSWNRPISFLDSWSSPKRW